MVLSTRKLSARAFEIAAKAAYRQSLPKAGPEILEPIMKLDVFCTEDKMGDVIGDLNRRRGMIKAQSPLLASALRPTRHYRKCLVTLGHFGP